MKYPSIEPTFFIQNRNRFINHLKPNSVAVFNSNDEFPRNGDQNFSFRQNSDLFYLSGIDQEKTILLLAPDCPIEAYREVLFTLETNEYLATWYGEKLSQEEVAKISGVKTALWLDSFEEVFSEVLKTVDTIYLNSNEN